MKFSLFLAHRGQGRGGLHLQGQGSPVGTLGKAIGGCASEEDHRAQTSRCSATRIGLKREVTLYQGVKVFVRVMCLPKEALVHCCPKFLNSSHDPVPSGVPELLLAQRGAGEMGQSWRSAPWHLAQTCHLCHKNRRGPCPSLDGGQICLSPISSSLVACLGLSFPRY